MIHVILFTAVIALLIFVYMRHITKRRRSKTADIDSVRDFHSSYDRIRTRRDLRDKESGYRSYVTKYNSSEDYRER